MRYVYYQGKTLPPILIGWYWSNCAFALCVDKFSTLVAWKEAWKIPGSYITDENGNLYSPDHMEMLITFNYGSESFLNYILSNREDFVEGSHCLISMKIGITFCLEVNHNYKCIGKEDCWDLCVRI